MNTTSVRALFGVLVAAICCLGQGTSKVVFLKDNDVYLAASGENGIKRLTTDGAYKSMLRLSPDGRKLAYRRQSGPGTAIGRVMVMTTEGEVVRDILFRPPGPVRELGMRFIERLWWAGTDSLVLYGSINPNNCEYVAVDVNTGQTTSDYGMACDTHVTSPDGAHLAYAGPPGIGVRDEDYRQCLDVDGRRVYTRQPNGQLLTDAVWSGDSSSLALIEENTPTKTSDVVVVTLKGEVTRVPVPPSFEPPMALQWIGDTLVLEAAGGRYSVLPETKSVMPVTIDVEDKLQAETEAKRAREAARQRAIALARKLGAQNDEIDVFLP